MVVIGVALACLEKRKYFQRRVLRLCGRGSDDGDGDAAAGKHGGDQSVRSMDSHVDDGGNFMKRTSSRERSSNGRRGRARCAMRDGIL